MKNAYSCHREPRFGASRSRFRVSTTLDATMLKRNCDVATRPFDSLTPLRTTQAQGAIAPRNDALGVFLTGRGRVGA